MLFGLLAGCGVRQLQPEGAVLDPWQRQRDYAPARSGAPYSGSPTVEFPILPLIPWAAAYDLDLVVVSSTDGFDMHEYARITTPEGPLWLAKDARLGTLEQTVVADVPATWMPELPVVRKTSPVRVTDRSTDDWLDLSLAYENIDGEAVTVEFAGPPPTAAQPKRNGSTMGHSRDSVLAVLDLSHRSFARKATLTIGGKKQRIARIAGLVPFRMALVQTQGGLATGRMHLEPVLIPDLGIGTGEFDAVHQTAAGDVRAEWRMDPFADDRILLVQDDGLRELRASFRDESGAFELESLEVRQWGRPNPTLHVVFSPALPDLRRRFAGRVTSRFAIDVNGQESHAAGRIEAWWDDAGAHLAVIPEAPWWTADRPMQVDVTTDGKGAADVVIARVPTENPSGRGARNRSPAD